MFIILSDLPHDFSNGVYDKFGLWLWKMSPVWWTWWRRGSQTNYVIWVGTGDRVSVDMVWGICHVDVWYMLANFFLTFYYAAVLSINILHVDIYHCFVSFPFCSPFFFGCLFFNHCRCHYLQQQICSSCFLSTDLRTKKQRRNVFWWGLKLRLKKKLLRRRSPLSWNMDSTILPTWLSRLLYLFLSYAYVICFHSELCCLHSWRNSIWHLFPLWTLLLAFLKCFFVTNCSGDLFAEQGTTGCYCSWCGPNRVGCMAPCLVQEDGDSLPHCEGEVSSGSGNSRLICLAIIYFLFKPVHTTWMIYLGPTCQQIVHKKTASALCLTTVKNEDKLEFSKILEAIKVDLNYNNHIAYCCFANRYDWF